MAGVPAAAVGGAVIARAEDDPFPPARAAQAEGGLSLATVNVPASATLIVDQTAQAGAARAFKVANNYLLARR